MKIAPLSGSVAAAVMLLSLSAAASPESTDTTPPKDVSATTPQSAPAAHCELPATQDATQALTPLTPGEIWAMNEALQDEYKARATYNKVLATFGNIRPFSNIVQAETRHIEALVNLYNKYGVAVPPDTWAEKVPTYASPQAACTAAVQAEIENGSLYDTIMPKAEKPDLIRVFTALRDASLERHLPAFQRCSEGSGGRGSRGSANAGNGNRGRGPGHGLGRRGRMRN